MRKVIFSLMALAFVACDNKEQSPERVDYGLYAFKQSEQVVELTPDTESVRIELYYTEAPDESQYGYVHLKYDAQKSTPNVERIVAVPTYQKWEIAEDGSLYYDMYINTEEVKSEVCIYLYVMFGNEAYSEHHREMVLRLTAPEWYSESVKVSKLMEECGDFDAETLAANIGGEWVMDSFLVYREGWTNISEIYRAFGVDYCEGLGYEVFTFNNDGKGLYYCEVQEPGIAPQNYRFDWLYNPDNGEFTLSGEYNLEWVVSGFNGDDLVLDRVDFDGDNLRTILKRK